MKKLLLLIAVFFSVSTVFSQDADQIIEKFKDKITNNDSVRVKSWKLSGIINTGEKQDPFNYYFRKPDRFRMDRPVKGIKTTFVIRDSVGYRGYMDMVYDINEAQLLEIKRMSTFADVLFSNFIRDSLDVQYVGEVEVNEEPAYKLKADTKEGYTDFYYISKKDHTLLMRTENTFIAGFPQETDIYFKNYKRIEGYLVPQKVIIDINGNTTSIDFKYFDPNFPLTDGVFANPQ